MTTPVERARYLRWGWEFLWELRSATNLSTAQQTAAQAILRHYPSPSEIDPWAVASVDLFAPMLAPEDHAALVSAPNSDVPVSVGRRPTSPPERLKALTDAYDFFSLELKTGSSQNLTQKQEHTLRYVLRHFPAPRGSAGIHVISGKKCLKPMFLNGFLELLSQRTATAPVARHLAEPDRNHRHRIAAKLHR
jgi:hypothetical protein